MNYQAGQIDLSSGGSVGFIPHKFSQAPVVILTLARNSFHNYPIVAYITSVNKDSFGYSVKYYNGGAYRSLAGDKLSWLAVSV
jgi:hypothetical protein